MGQLTEGVDFKNMVVQEKILLRIGGLYKNIRCSRFILYI